MAVAARTLAGVGALGRFFVFGLTYAIGRPAMLMNRLIFRVVLLPLYRPYVRIKQRVRKHPAVAELENIGHFFQRYSLYAAIVMLGLLVTSHNIFARTIRPDEVGQGAIWTSLAPNDDLAIVIDSSPAKKLNSAPVLAVGGAVTTAPVLPAVASPATDTAVGQNRIADTDSGSDPISRTDVIQYTVEGGDTVSTIAARFGISSRSVLWANGLGEYDYIKPGQSLKIPPQSGVLYTVKQGDTLASIVQKYKGDIDEILTANRLAVAEAIQPGMELMIPNGEVPAPPAPAAPTRTLLGGIFSRPTTTNIPPSVSGGAGRFVWPTPNRRINQYYRGRYHTGIDIEGHYSSPIYASAGGTVTFAAFNRSGYGLHIIIDHGNGYKTLYGHASKIFVKVGQRVERGQTIAMVGSTGRSTGTHLHFEIRTGSGFLNPLSFF